MVLFCVPWRISIHTFPFPFSVCVCVCIHMCTCMYTHICTCMCVLCMYMCIVLCVYPYPCICVYVCMYMCVYMYICTCKCECLHACIYVCMCTYICVCLYMDICVCVYNVCTYNMCVFVWYACVYVCQILPREIESYLLVFTKLKKFSRFQHNKVEGEKTWNGKEGNIVQFPVVSPSEQFYCCSNHVCSILVLMPEQPECLLSGLPLSSEILLFPIPNKGIKNYCFYSVRSLWHKPFYWEENLFFFFA